MCQERSKILKRTVEPTFSSDCSAQQQPPSSAPPPTAQTTTSGPRYKAHRHNNTAMGNRIPQEILSVRYEDGKWSKPYYDCGGGNIWMLTYTVPFFGYVNSTYIFKGTSGIDIDLRRVDIDQCPLPKGGTQLNIFAASDKCKRRTTMCVPIPGLGFRRGSYKCVCRPGFYFPDIKAERRYYNGTVLEEEYEKRMLGEDNQYDKEGMFECLTCPEGCESCEDERPCVVTLNWVMRTVILILSCVIICCLPIVVFFTWKYGNVKVVRAASPVLLRVIALGAFFIYSTMIVMYPKPTVYTCTARVWLREIGFSLTYGALMLKTWRISVIFRVRSAKAVKITDTNLLKRLGVILTIFTAFLIIRTLVAPPVVIVGRTADDLKAYLCRTDWWDHLFSTSESSLVKSCDTPAVSRKYLRARERKQWTINNLEAMGNDGVFALIEEIPSDGESEASDIDSDVEDLGNSEPDNGIPGTQHSLEEMNQMVDEGEHEKENNESVFSDSDD
uniref:Probable G-protein coupled receptor CG31760 n=1 Tax=Diabrotica virgifera virgifera TaxID=50390 RepID=A0A6P7EZK0_DIAVI